MSKRKLNQDIQEIVHILMDTFQKQAKTQVTHQVLPSFTQENGVILVQNGEKLGKIHDTHKKLPSFTQESSVILAQNGGKQAETQVTHQILPSFDQQNSVILVQNGGKQGKTQGTHQVSPSFTQENTIIIPQSVQKQGKTQDTHQILPTFTQENTIIIPKSVQKQAKTQDTHQVLPSFGQENGEKQSKTCTILDDHRQKAEVKTLESSKKEAMTLNGDEEGLGVGPRERLKRHRKEVAGQVWIPDIWGQEELLKDWIDSSGFDKCLRPHSIMSARASLIQEGRRASSASLSVENSC